MTPDEIDCIFFDVPEDAGTTFTFNDACNMVDVFSNEIASVVIADVQPPSNDPTLESCTCREYCCYLRLP